MKKTKLTPDDVVIDVQKSLQDWVREAYRQAIKEGIEATSIVLNKNFVKTNGFPFAVGHYWHRMPPMICGLEIHVTDDLPDKIDFALVKAPMTEREKLIEQTVHDTVRKMQRMLKETMVKPEYPWDDFTVTESAIDYVVNTMLGVPTDERAD